MHTHLGHDGERLANGGEDIVGEQAAVKHVAVWRETEDIGGRSVVEHTAVVALVLGNVRHKVVVRALAASSVRDLRHLVQRDHLRSLSGSSVAHAVYTLLVAISDVARPCVDTLSLRSITLMYGASARLNGARCPTETRTSKVVLEELGGLALRVLLADVRKLNAAGDRLPVEP